jgi:O-antigen/teichoic acid export membrane protein
MVFVTAGILAIGLFISAPWFASRTLAAPQLANSLKIGAVLIMLTALNGAQIGALVGLEAFKVTAKLNLYTGLVSLPLVVGGVVYLGLEGALWGLTFTAALNWLFNHLALRREAARIGIPLTFKGCLQEWHVLWTFSLPAVISGMLAAPVNWVCNAFLVNQHNGYAEMGIVNAANQWFFALLFIPGILARCSIPLLSERFGANDKFACRRVIRYSIMLNTAVVVPLVVIGCFASRYIMGIYGAGFADHSAVLMAALITAGVLSIQMPLGQMTAASGRMWTEICMNLGWAILICGGTWLGESYGALGLMTARLIAYTVHTLWTTWFVYFILSQKDAIDGGKQEVSFSLADE